MNVKDTLLKLRKMIESGTENEKILAEKLYEKIINKYDVDETYIQDNKRTYREFKVKNEIEATLIKQVHSMVTNLTTYKKFNDKRKKNILFMECTDMEYELTSAYFQLYNEALKKEIDSFVDAFILKNNLISNIKYDVTDDTPILSDEEKWKIAQYSAAIGFVQKPCGLLEKN